MKKKEPNFNNENYMFCWKCITDLLYYYDLREIASNLNVEGVYEIGIEYWVGYTKHIIVFSPLDDILKSQKVMIEFREEVVSMCEEIVETQKLQNLVRA